MNLSVIPKKKLKVFKTRSVTRSMVVFFVLNTPYWIFLSFFLLSTLNVVGGWLVLAEAGAACGAVDRLVMLTVLVFVGVFLKSFYGVVRSSFGFVKLDGFDRLAHRSSTSLVMLFGILLFVISSFQHVVFGGYLPLHFHGHQGFDSFFGDILSIGVGGVLSFLASIEAQESVAYISAFTVFLASGKIIKGNFVDNFYSLLYVKIPLLLVPYCFLGVSFSYLYMVFYQIDYESFSGVSGVVDFFYFSFVTITTLGYGDVLPVSSGVKLAVIFETVIGIFYMAVVVGIVIAKMLPAGVKKEDHVSDSSTNRANSGGS